MIIDTSAWVEFSRTGSDSVRAAIGAALASGEAMTGRSAACAVAAQADRVDVDDAAVLFQRCRRAGDTVRSPNDCLIAAIALRMGVAVLHRDRDFDVIARHAGLETVRA